MGRRADVQDWIYEIWCHILMDVPVWLFFMICIFRSCALRALDATHKAGSEGQREEAPTVSKEEHMFFFML